MKLIAANSVDLDKSDLTKSLEEINLFPRKMGATGGLTRVFYSDEHDSFEMLLQPSTAGYTVSCRLNNRQSYQLNGIFWGQSRCIGDVMLRACSAPAATTIEEFFN